METHVVCGLRVPVQSPTVGLYIEVPQDRPSGWSWAPLDGYNPAAEDMVFAEAELARVMRSYGSTCAGLLHAQGSIGRFRLVARGLYSRRVLGTHEWAWRADVGRYDAVGEPWLLWDMQTSAHDDQGPARPAYSLSGLSRYARGGERENPLASKRSNTRTEQGVRPVATKPRDPRTAAITRTRHVLTGGRWFLIVGLVFYSLMTTTPFVSAHSEWAWSGFVLGLIVDAAFIMALSAESTLARHGVTKLGRWPAAFRWLTGLSTVFLNVWLSVERRDWVGVAVHLIAPVLVMLLAEVGPVYMAALADAERDALKAPEAPFVGPVTFTPFSPSRPLRRPPTSSGAMSPPASCTPRRTPIRRPCSSLPPTTSRPARMTSW